MTQLAIGEATPHGATYDGHGVNFGDAANLLI